MKNLIKLALCGVAFVLAACGPVGPEGNTDPTGITYKSCEDKMEISGQAQQVIITITADAPWTAKVSQTKIARISSGASGDAGTHDIVLDFVENETAYSRNLTLSAKVEGVDQQIKICVIEQKSVSEKGTDANVNKNFTWPLLERYYLWNGDLKKVGAPKWDQAYDDFLDNALKSIYPTNSMDGYLYTYSSGQQEWFFYSYIQRTTPTTSNVTRAEKTFYQGYGAWVYTVQYDENSNNLHFAVEYVYPDSPAEKAGLKRGHFISKVNGTTVNMNNYQDLLFNTFYYEVPVGTTCTFEVCEFDWNTLNLSTKTTTLTATSAAYYENPVLYYDIFSYKSTTDTSKKANIAYMVYNLFDAAFDDEIKKAFDLFKEASAEIGDMDYLILDLRYNGGGNVASCRYLSSIIAGTDAMNGSKPKVFMYSRYNDERMAEQGRDKSDYTTYKSDDFDSSAAAAYNFPFKEIYVIGTGDTASSSEMLINGLRGIGEKVVLVGGTTNGKNVGMEVWNTQNTAVGSIDGNHYTFAPISFQAYNCKGESNFDNGFVPDIECQSTYDGYPPVDWGTYYIEALYQGQKVYYMPDYFSKALDTILSKEFPQTASVKRVSSREASLNTKIRRMAAPERKQDIFRNNAWVVAEE